VLPIDIVKRFSSVGGGGAPGTVAISDDSDAGLHDAAYRLEGDGDISHFGGADIGDWLSPKSGMDQYEVRATLDSGNTPTGSALNAWLNLGSDRSWALSAPGTGTFKSCTLTIEIRRVSDHVIVDTASVYLECGTA
jgi:hypothetical protein